MLQARDLNVQYVDHELGHYNRSASRAGTRIKQGRCQAAWRYERIARLPISA